MKRFLLSLVITALVGSSVLAGDDRAEGESADALAAKRGRQAAPHARQAAPNVRRAGTVTPRARLARQDAPRGRQTRQAAPNGRPARPRLAANPARRTPDWGRAARNFRTPGTNLGWHVRRPNGVVIARNYANWSRNWWSPKWGFWFRYDPTTSGYYYYEPTVGYYVQTETITTYHQPLETPIDEPTTDPDDIPVDDPPDPVEP